MKLAAIWMTVTLVATVLTVVYGHGRLLDPPSRSSMWRFGFKNKPNYNDNELFCGGYAIQWQMNKGKCGVCGDPWHQPKPRDNEAGGKYAKGIIVRSYQPGQKITAKVQLTANHRGYFEFRICPNNNPKVEATQECLDQHPLRIADRSSHRYMLPSSRSGTYNVEVMLPEGLTCSQCVFQWTYTAGNNWGSCGNGTSKVGCGPQETFRGCADITIGSKGQTQAPVTSKPKTTTVTWWRPPTHPVSTYRPRPTARPPPTYRPTTRTVPTYKPRATTTYRPYNKWTTPKTRVTPKPWSKTPPFHKTTPNPKVTPWIDTNEISDKGKTKNCVSRGTWKKMKGMNAWCSANCARGYCPTTHCVCQ